MTSFINALNPPYPLLGLVNDGKTDNTDLLQNMLNNYNYIYVPNLGEYKFERNIILNDDNVLEGKNTKLILEIDSDNWSKNVTINGSNVKINGFIIKNGGIVVNSGNFSNIEICNNHLDNYVTGIAMCEFGTYDNIEIHHNTISNQVDWDPQLLFSRNASAGIFISNISSGIICKNVKIHHNNIYNTNTYGISFGNSKNENFDNVLVYNNTISYIGMSRRSGLGDYQSTTGIYGGDNVKNIDLYENDIRYCVENGIEGSFGKVYKNYIQDTTWNRFYMPIVYGLGGVGIYGNIPFISNNIIVNSGATKGAISCNELDCFDDMTISNNVIVCKYKQWKANSNYKINDQILVGENVYRCITSGTTGSNLFTETNTSEITDGTCVWVFSKLLDEYGINFTTNVGYKLNILGNTFEGVKKGIFTNIPKDVICKNNIYNITTYEKYSEFSKRALISNEGNLKIIYDIDFTRGDSIPTLYGNSDKYNTSIETGSDNLKYMRMLCTTDDVFTALQIKENAESEGAYYIFDITGRISTAGDISIVLKNYSWDKHCDFPDTNVTNEFYRNQFITYVSADKTLGLAFKIASANSYIDIQKIRISKIIDY